MQEKNTNKRKSTVKREKEDEAAKAADTKKGKHYDKRDRNEEKKKWSYLPIILLVIAGVIILLVIKYSLSNAPNVPFTTFKTNFQSAQRVAIGVIYSNGAEYVNESGCFSTIVEVISRSRNASTIDFYAINATNSSQCTYAPNGLGHAFTPQTANTSYCFDALQNEPSVILNYSTVNNTRTTPYHIYIHANNNYLAECPIAVDLS